mmetsp:Transcript_37232/g.89188  ORF Transcript_37232/g.89188 Transcript_37232/m.89188 type:complete len:91 (-) Transcript_37232:319-591(-)
MPHLGNPPVQEPPVQKTKKRYGTERHSDLQLQACSAVGEVLREEHAVDLEAILGLLPSAQLHDSLKLPPRTSSSLSELSSSSSSSPNSAA